MATKKTERSTARGAVAAAPSAGPHPRRRPARRTGAEIVGAILDACESMLEDVAASEIRANGLAARAGVSVGSLYQYFPNVEAVLAELSRRQELRGIAELRRIHASLDAIGPAEAIREILRMSLGDRIGSIAFRAALRSHIPRGWVGQEVSQLQAVLAALLADVGKRVEGAPEPELLAWRLRLASYAVEGVMNAALVHKSEVARDPRTEAEVFRLVWPYVFGPAVP